MRTGLIVMTITSLTMAALTAWQVIPQRGWLGKVFCGDCRSAAWFGLSSLATCSSTASYAESERMVVSPPNLDADWEFRYAPYDALTYETALRHLEQTDIVLDIGAGDLRFARQAAARVRCVIAIEQNAGLLQRALALELLCRRTCM